MTQTDDYKSEYLAFWGYKEGTLEAEDAWAAKLELNARTQPSHYIISEEKNYKPYKSMITGEMIEGRKQHREHLKRHGVVEAHDMVKEKPTPKPNMPDARLKEQIARQVYEKLSYR